METIDALSLPPGFGFHPTDVELISHYLKKKILGHKVEFEVIPEVDIYKHEPWDLPAKSQIPTRDCKWHFFTARDRKYPNGSRSNRATEAGYWKSTGKDRNVRFNKHVIGTKKTLVFHKGKPPHGKRTDWIMHEYYLNENECKTAPSKDIFVLCRVTKRNGLTKEDEELPSTQAEKKISPCVPLPGRNCPKELQDISAHLMPKKEACSPGEDDLEAWFTELYDPNFCTDQLTESRNEDKIDLGSVDVKHDLENCFLPNHTQETRVSVPEEHGYYSIFGYQFNAYAFDDHPFGLPNSETTDNIYMHEPGFDVGYPLYPSYAVGFEEDEVLTDSSLSSVGLLANHGGVIPEDSQERIAPPVPSFSGHQDITVDTGIQIRERRGKPSNELPTQRIRLQVHKMESRNPGTINQTFVFVSEDDHLVSTCELNQDSIRVKAEAHPHRSEAFTDSHQIRAQLQGKHGIESEGRKSETNKPEGPFSLGSVFASMLSRLRRRKSVDSRKSSRKSHKGMSQASGFLRGACPLLRKCSLAGLNCLFMVTCMLGTGTLITFFVVRDARRFLSSAHAFVL